MATLASRDTTGTFAESPGERELVDQRTRGFKKFALADCEDTGRERFRVGGQIGPVHYRLDPFSEVEEWKEIDLALEPCPQAGWDYQCLANGYQVYVAQKFALVGQGHYYTAQFRRGGSWLRMAPLEVAWENAAGERQVIGKPKPGIEPVIDNEADTCTWPDAFGPGLSFRYNLAPDHFYKTVIVERADALPKPTIDRAGLRLTVVMALAWSRDAGPEGFAVGRRVEEFDETADPDLPPHEEVRNPGLYPHVRKRDGRQAFWIAEPKAWDSYDPGEEDEPEAQVPHRWPVAMRLRRHGAQVFAALSLDARVLREATFPVFIDTDIPEEQVGASSDDAGVVTSSNNWVITDTYVMLNRAAGTNHYGARFTTVPIPSGATIDSAAMSACVYGTNHDSPNFTMYGNDVADAATFATSSDTPDGRAKTTATMVDARTDIGAGFQSLPDMTDIVQEIIDNGGWASGNALAFITYNGSSPPGSCIVKTYDDASTYAAKFNCSYTAGGGAAGNYFRNTRLRNFRCSPKG